MAVGRGVRVRDMMIDRVAPCRGAAAHSLWAVRGHCLEAVVARSDSKPMELAALVPVIVGRRACRSSPVSCRVRSAGDGRGRGRLGDVGERVITQLAEQVHGVPDDPAGL